MNVLDTAKQFLHDKVEREYQENRKNAPKYGHALFPNGEKQCVDDNGNPYVLKDVSTMIRDSHHKANQKVNALLRDRHLLRDSRVTHVKENENSIVYTCQNSQVWVLKEGQFGWYLELRR